MKRYILLLFTLLLTFNFYSCSDYLDVSDELAGELELNEVFDNPNLVRRFHRYIYSGIPDMSFICINSSYSAVGGLGNPWTSVSDELKSAQNNVKDIPVTGYHAGNASFSRWDLYKRIRQANMFMERAKVIPQVGETDYLDEKELVQLNAEAKFFRAYYHFLLFELYGPIPIMTEVANHESGKLDYYRSSLDEVIEFLDEELLECADLLAEKELDPDKEQEAAARRAVPTKGVALAVRAKMWMYAASPLFNGGYEEAVALRDDKGEALFPPYNESKWEKALVAVEDFIKYAEKGYYKLHIKLDKQGELDPDESLYTLFQEYNDEIIWATTYNSWGSVNGEGTDRRMTPRSEYQGFACVGVLQELVDDFYMKDGLSIKESPLYKENGFSPYGEHEDMIYNMYINREPRFYQAVTFQGRRWQVSDRQIFFHKGSGNDNSKADNPYTGALLYKWMNRKLLNQGSNERGKFRPVILYRLADFYLLYAEALNEVSPTDKRIVEYIDKVRYRAGIPLLKDIKPEIIGNKKLQKEAIIKERRIELCVEGQRYFDVRRWMLAESDLCRQGGDFHGMNMNGDEESFYQRTPFEHRVFEKRMYLYPLPLSEVQKSEKLVQNPGW